MTAATIVIEHGIILSRIVVHLDLSRVLERQILLSLASVEGNRARVGGDVVLKIYLLLVIVLMGFGTMCRVLKRQLRLRLIHVLLLEVFVIIIEYLVVHVEVLARVKRSTLITLITLRQLFLRRNIEVAGSYSKLFHVSLRIDILDALVHAVNRAWILLVLRLG